MASVTVFELRMSPWGLTADLLRNTCFRGLSNLGYKSKIPFEEGIRRTAEWYKTTYEKNEVQVCSEVQGCAPSMAATLV